MKRRTLFVILFITISFGFAQTKFDTESQDSTNIYYKSLKTLCEISDHTKMKDPTFYVEKNLFTNKLPDKILGFNIKYLTESEQVDLIQKKGGKMIIVRIVPLRAQDGIFFVNIIPFRAFYNKGNLELANGGGLKVEYEFDPKLNGLVFKKAQFNGI